MIHLSLCFFGTFWCKTLRKQTSALRALDACSQEDWSPCRGIDVKYFDIDVQDHLTVNGVEYWGGQWHDTTTMLVINNNRTNMNIYIYIYILIEGEVSRLMAR